MYVHIILYYREFFITKRLLVIICDYLGHLLLSLLLGAKTAANNGQKTAENEVFSTSAQNDEDEIKRAKKINREWD